MNGSFDWLGTTAFVVATSILLWLVARSRLPRAIRVVLVLVFGLLLATCADCIGAVEIVPREPAAEAFPAGAEGVKAAFRQAERNGRMASEALYRCRRYVDGWLARADPATGLIPRNLRESDFWNGRDAAADNYPYMVLTAAMPDRGLLEGRMLEMLRTETRLTCRLGRLPDDYSFSRKGWRREALVAQ